MEERDILTERIIGCCFKVHTAIGPGFNEKIYHNALKIIFDKEKLHYQTSAVKSSLISNPMKVRDMTRPYSHKARGR